MQRPFFLAGYYGVKPNEITPRMRANAAATLGRTPYGEPLPIASSETGYNQEDIPWYHDVYDYSLRNKRGPFYSVTPNNVGGFQTPQIPRGIIDFLPESLQKMKQQSQYRIPIPFREALGSIKRGEARSI
jgi:hypothetical protein